jgi:hypothetical protein
MQLVWRMRSKNGDMIGCGYWMTIALLWPTVCGNFLLESLCPISVTRGWEFSRQYRLITPPELPIPEWFVDVVISSGSLVHREAVEVSGLPRADFFMDFVDFEYCFRMRRHGYKIAVVRDSQLEHTIGEPRAVKILGYSKSWPVQQPWREYYSSRNYTFTIWDYFPNWRSKAYVLWRLLRHAVGIVAFGTNKFACLKMMLTGFLDGCSGRLGVRFRADGASKMLEPSVHASEVSVHN